MSNDSTTDTTQYLTFKLGGEVFAVDVAKVREILDFTPATRVPGMPDFVCGVINVRGNVVPVVDMRIKFGMSATVKTVDTCIVVVEIQSEDAQTVLGALVDSVQEVFELEAAHVEPPPRLGMRWKTEYIKGIGKRENTLIIILDVDRVFNSLDLASVEEASSQHLA